MEEFIGLIGLGATALLLTATIAGCRKFEGAHWLDDLMVGELLSVGIVIAFAASVAQIADAAFAAWRAHAMAHIALQAGAAATMIVVTAIAAKAITRGLAPAAKPAR